MVPIMYDWILNLPDEVLGKYDIASLKHVAACGAPLQDRTVKKILKRFHQAEVSNWLGASEFGFISNTSFKNGLKAKKAVSEKLFLISN